MAAECGASIVGLGSLRDVYVVECLRHRTDHKSRPSAVEFVTEQFVAFGTAVIRSHKRPESLPESTLVTIPENPEHVSNEELNVQADYDLAKPIDRLET